MAGGHNKVNIALESSFRSKDLSLALTLSLRRGLRRVVASVRRVLGHLPHTAALWLAVASHCCSN